MFFPSLPDTIKISREAEMRRFGLRELVWRRLNDGDCLITPATSVGAQGK
jgi:hypothetical protein